MSEEENMTISQQLEYLLPSWDSNSLPAYRFFNPPIILTRLMESGEKVCCSIYGWKGK
jgi:hypothetical protein